MTAGVIDESPAVAAVERILHQRIGLDVTTVGRSLVQSAVRRRMSAVGISAIHEYVARLGSDEQELQELVEAVVVPETYFFREPEALAELGRRLDSSGGPTHDRPVRILSAPCSTGEEPYSVAMTLLAAGHPAAAIAIDAVDVSHEAVRRARRAEYRASAFRGETFDWRPYFDVQGAERTLRPSVRELVRVVQGNLLDPRFRPPREQYDVVFCRNLLIYFDIDAQSRVLATLRALLAPGGILVVGAADSFAVRRAGFVPVAGAERAFLFHVAPPGAEVRASISQDRTDSVRARRPRPVPTRREAPMRREPVLRAQQPARVPAANVPAGSESSMDAMVRLAAEGRLDEVIRAGESAMEGSSVSADLLVLLGTSHESLGDAVLAERSYRRALYVDPSHAEALLHLALLLELRGDGDEAGRLRARARRSIAGAGGESA